MKKVALLSLALALSTAALAEDFGGINFHSSVPQDQLDSLKVDINYLYKTPVTNPDAEFQEMSGLPVVDGPNMHNWLLNRVKHVIGESFEVSGDNVTFWLFHRFPKTPLPDVFNAVSGQDEVVTVMSNIGSAIYLAGKKEDVLLGLKLDGDKVYAKSARVGILQVGKGLFLERFLLNKDLNAPANSVSRLGTLFHEARHSDGNGAHTGFLHAKCPTGHAYEGHAACDTSSNGPYTLGALTERNLILNCADCSLPEKSALGARAADSFGRIIDLGLASKRAEILAQIKSLEEVKASYESLIKIFADDKMTELREMVKKYKAEIAELEKQLALLREELAALANVKPVNLALDPTPEGKFDAISLKDSVKMMNKTLRK